MPLTFDGDKELLIGKYISVIDTDGYAKTIGITRSNLEKVLSKYNNIAGNGLTGNIFDERDDAGVVTLRRNVRKRRTDFGRRA